ncbi:MAG: hypothetical protein Q7R88_00100 [bacterium]|nr:hypothetical protein [bacterium]
MLKRYLEYFKDNPEGYWFKRKLYGWGWMPVRWQGWAVLVIFAVLFTLNVLRLDAGSHSVSDARVMFAPSTVILVLILIGICWKTGEKPKWQWGLPKKDETPKI